LGEHPATGGKIQASIGPYGPYVVHDQGKEGKDYRSLKASDDILTITLERALEILAEPKKGRKTSSNNSKAALRELGSHPTDGEPVNIYDGRYGPYIKHGKTNVSLPEGKSAEDMTLATALELLATKESSAKSTRKSSSKASTNGKATTAKKKTTTRSSSKTTSTTKSKAKT
jgi:DNA topoisomerase-1